MLRSASSALLRALPARGLAATLAGISAGAAEKSSRGWRKPGHFIFDPVFGQPEHRQRFLAGGVDQGTDAHRHLAGIFEEGIAPPALAGIVRDRQDRRADARRQPGAADAVTSALARRHARAFGKNNHIVAARQSVASLLENLVARGLAAFAVDRNRLQSAQHPAY